ncbi:hypothetical protein [Azospirillum halopraeferens]|uniref:hypothetical protein n=1 Tax=Azospirillum halopraeferens TaxID=34010 RepID=UPI00040E71E3|nr:hypothetical protein [Azospirillum halopraeferens]
MSLSFSRFIAIDWSGAKGPRYAGVAVAECTPGDGAPHPVPPPAGGRWWSRTAVHDWLLTVAAEEPALVGIDCAFSLPFAVAGRYGAADAFALWDLVERVTAGHPDFLGGPFAEHPAYAGDFWLAGTRPAGYGDPHRGTEHRCRADGLGSPQSPFKLIGSKQVGRGALAGMRLLRSLRARGGGGVAVWPFETPRPGATVLVEIYPRLFLRHAGFGQRKIRAAADVDAALARLGSAPAGLTDAVSDHDADALVSAAGLRFLAGHPAVWSPPALDEEARRREGWIFGVGAEGAGMAAVSPGAPPAPGSPPYP